MPIPINKGTGPRKIQVNKELLAFACPENSRRYSSVNSNNVAHARIMIRPLSIPKNF